MAKAEWGIKRTCPKCGTRFYDLGSNDPVTCIECSNKWMPEAVLKSKQPLPYDQVVKEKDVEKVKDDTDLESDDLDLDVDVDEEEPSPDNDVDLGGDDDLGVVKTGDSDVET